MLTPQQLTEVIDTMQPLLDGLNAFISRDIIRRIMARLGRGEDLMLTATDEWQLQVLQEAGGHLEEVQAEIQRFTKASDTELQAIFETAGITAWEADSLIYEAFGLNPTPLRQSDRMVKILNDTYQRTKGTIDNFTRTTATASQQRLIKLLDNAHFRVLTGAQSYTAAVSDIINEIAKEQIKVVYPTGHSDTIETAVLRAVRTGVAQATGNIAVQGMKDNKWDLVRVSAHLGARVGDGGENPSNHYWWQGGLYSLSGESKKYPDFYESTGYGTGEGLCGWNCRHSFGPGDEEHNPFKKYDTDENKRVYELSQKQRTYEARIRQSKLEVLTLNEAIQNCKDESLLEQLNSDYQKAARLLQRRNAKYTKFCEDNGLKKLSDRVKIAKWDRKQAAKATAAARKE